jgi:hypothetical protein
MTSLAAALAHLRDSELLSDRVVQFDTVIALATRIERELAEATRAIETLHHEQCEEAELAEREAEERRIDDEAREAAIEAAHTDGKLVRFPWHRVRRCGMAPNSDLGAA